MTIAELLERELRAATLPIVGVTIADVNDRTTWAALWNVVPTAQQVSDAQTIINGLDVSLESLAASAAAGAIDNDPVVQALVEMISLASGVTYSDARLNFIGKFEALHAAL